jgi:type IV pilus assembly protein PilQ
MRSLLLACLCAVLLLVPDAASAQGRAPLPKDKIHLNVHRADVQTVLRLLCDRARLNLVMGDDVKGTVTLQLRDVAWADALEMVLRSNSLGYEKKGGILRVAPLARLQEEALVREKLEKARRNAGPLTTYIIPINYGLAKDMAPLVKEQLSERGSVSVDARTNSLIIRDVELPAL